MNASLLRLMPLVVFGIATANAQQLTTTADVNVRRGPSTRSAVITTLVAGTDVTLLRTRSGFDRVQTSDGTIGWIYGRYLTGATAPSATVTPPTTTGSSTTGSSTTGTSTTGTSTTRTSTANVAAGTYHACDIMGKISPNAPNVAALQQLNLQKNRATDPADADIDPNFTLANLLQPKPDDSRFDATKGGVIEGIVVDAKVGGVETVNCKATDPVYRDTHIEVAQQSSAAATARVIVEVTPRWRDAMSKTGADWTTPGLKALCGHHVRFRGWVMFDAEHRAQAKNTAPTNANDWRATVWELHPVTSFEVLDPQASGAACLTP